MFFDGIIILFDKAFGIQKADTRNNIYLAEVFLEVNRFLNLLIKAIMKFLSTLICHFSIIFRWNHVMA